MKLLIFTMLLAIMHAPSPVPRKAADSTNQTADSAEQDTAKHKKPIVPTPSAQSTPAKQSEGKEVPPGNPATPNAEQAVKIRELPSVSVSRDWADWALWAASTLLAFAGVLGIYLAYRTLKGIEGQVAEMKAQRQVMDGQLAAMKDQLEQVKGAGTQTDRLIEQATAQASHTSKVAEAALLNAKATIHSERPWLLIPIEDKIYDIQPPVIVERLAGTLSEVRSGCAFGVKNYGRSPARVIERKLWLIRIGDASLPHLSAYEREGCLTMDYVVAPGTTIPVSVPLQGGDGKLTPQEKEAIDTGMNFLWLAGYLRYTDTFDRQDSPIYETRICYRWIPRSYLIPEPMWWRQGSSEYNGTT